MPGTVRPPEPDATLPFSVSTKFVEVHALPVNGNEYHDGSMQRLQLADSGRRTWKIGKKLTVTNLDILRNFWTNHRRGEAFFFYNPHETDPPFSHSPTGTSGRYIVRFNSGWEETMGIVRSEVPIEITEIASAEDILIAQGNDPTVVQAIQYTLSTTTAWIADFDGRSQGNISTYGTTFSFGRLPVFRSGTSWAKRTDSFRLDELVDSGSLPLTTEAGIRSLAVYFFSDNYPATVTNAGQQKAEFHVYDISLTVIYEDSTIRIFHPTTSFLLDNGTAEATNASSAVDGDTNSFATVIETPMPGLLWAANTPSPLVVTDFR